MVWFLAVLDAILLFVHSLVFLMNPSHLPPLWRSALCRIVVLARLQLHNGSVDNGTMKFDGFLLSLWRSNCSVGLYNILFRIGAPKHPFHHYLVGR